MKYIKENIWMLAAFTTILSFGLMRSIYVPEADVLWQIKSGQDLLADGVFTRPDTYSWISTGKEYVSNSWLWNVLVFLIYQATGFLGVAAFAGFMTASILSLLAYTMYRHQISWFAIFFFIAVIGVLSNPWLAPRPQIFDYFFLALAWAVTSHIDISKKRGHLILVSSFAVITILWGNFHLTGLVGAFCLAALYFLKQTGIVDVRSKEIFAPILKTAGALTIFLLCCFLTPYGVEGVTKPLVTMGSSIGIIIEWLSPWTFTMLINTLSAVAITLFTAALFLAHKKFNWVELLLAVGLLTISSWQSRWTPFMVITLCVMFGKAFDTISSKHKFIDSIYTKTVASAIVFTVFAASMTTFIPHSRVDDAEYGFTLVEAIPADCKIYNEPAIGAPIILTRPELKVSLDGRNDLYGLQEYMEQNSIGHNREYAYEWFNNHEIECVLLHGDRPLNGWLAEDSQWKLVKEDNRGAKLWTRDI